MNATKRKFFLVVTAMLEAPLGVSLVLLPAFPLAILIGLETAAVETLFVGRVAGAALIAIGIASWMARADSSTAAQFGLLTGLLVYDAAAVLLLVYAATILKMSGVLLWPAVVLHAVLAAWCFSCLRPDGLMGSSRHEGVDRTGL